MLLTKFQSQFATQRKETDRVNDIQCCLSLFGQLNDSAVVEEVNDLLQSLSFSFIDSVLLGFITDCSEEENSFYQLQMLLPKITKSDAVVLIFLFIHSFTHSLIHSFTHSFFHSFTLSLFHSFTLSLLHSFILSLFHSLIITITL